MYDWSKPVSWEEFKGYPHHIQKECLLHFAEKWGCSRSMFAEMCKVNIASLGSYSQRYKLCGLLKRQPSIGNRIAFENWLSLFEAVSEPEPVEEEPPKEKKKELVSLNPIFTKTVKEGRITLSGKGSEVAQTLWGIFQTENVKMTIEFELLEE